MSSYFPLIFLIIILFVTQRNEKMIVKHIINKKRGANTQMYELAQSFIGKECIVYTFNSQLTGTIRQVNEGGILLEKSGEQEAVNFDFIVRIREYPRNKNGKKKSVVLD
ncbi:MAG: hypothetical protein IKB04_01025 [Clostridia bacterium]|nr:hypothetical protein [Clostridia bacterium]